MNLDTRALVARLRLMLAGFTIGQRVTTVLALVGLVVGAVFLTKWEGQTTYAPLFSNLAASDAQAVMSSLDAQHEPYKIAENGTSVLVPQSDVYKLRISLSAAGLPSNDQTGYSLLDKQGMTTSDFEQHIDYQRALEGELAKTIDAIDGVQSSLVHLVVPSQAVFATDTSKASASVLIRTTNGAALSSDEVEAVVHLVSSSVDNLSPDNVTVADASGHVLSAPGVATAAGADGQNEVTSAYNAQEASQLQAMVDQVVGAGHSVVQVSAALDLAQSKTNSQTYVQQPGVLPLTTNSTKEVYTGAGAPGAASSGVLGPDNNGVSTGAVSASSASGKSSYTKSSAQNTNAVGTVTTETNSVPGAVSRLSIAVLLDSSAAGGNSPATIAKIKSVIGAAAGVVPTRGDSVTVTSLPFQASAIAATKMAIPPKAGIGGLLKTAGMGLALLLLLIVALLGTRRTTRTPVELSNVWDNEGPLALGSPERRRALDATGPLALAVPAEPTLLLPERVVASRSLDDELTELVERQPEDLAHLLRGWLAERRT